MTALNPEIIQPEPKQETKPDANAASQIAEANVAQAKPETPSKKETAESEPPEDPNWRAFREGRKKDRMEREAAEKRASEKEAEAAALKAAMEAAFSKSAPTPQAYQQYYGMNQPSDQSDETEEQKIDRKVNEALAKKEEQFRRQAAEEEQREYPKRLMRDFPDFSRVCSQENLDYLDYHYPEISRPLQRLGDG